MQRIPALNIGDKHNKKSGLKDYVLHNNIYNATNNGKQQQQQHVTILKNNISYHAESNFRYVYGNPDGYTVPDGGSKGGYLIRAITDVFNTDHIVKGNDLNDIVDQIRTQTQELAGKHSLACVEDVNSMMYKVYFDKYQTK